MTAVVDASVWVSSLIPADVFHAVSRGWLRQQVAEREQLVVPALMLAEVAGAISRRTHRPADGRSAIDVLLRLGALRIVAIDGRLGKAAATLAAMAGLRGADAIYAALAQHLSLPLVTWDDELQQRTNTMIAVQRPTRPQA